MKEEIEDEAELGIAADCGADAVPFAGNDSGGRSGIEGIVEERVRQLQRI